VADGGGGCGDSTLQNPLSLLGLLLFALVSGHEEDIETLLRLLAAASLPIMLGVVPRLQQRPGSCAATRPVQVVCDGTSLILPTQSIFIAAFLRLRLSCNATARRKTEKVCRKQGDKRWK
jgi:hypothetical protein